MPTWHTYHNGLKKPGSSVPNRILRLRFLETSLLCPAASACPCSCRVARASPLSISAAVIDMLRCLPACGRDDQLKLVTREEWATAAAMWLLQLHQRSPGSAAAIDMPEVFVPAAVDDLPILVASEESATATAAAAAAVADASAAAAAAAEAAVPAPAQGEAAQAPSAPPTPPPGPK